MMKRQLLLQLVLLLCFIFTLQVTAQTRLGLHYTKEELNIWRERAVKGPYKSEGDAGVNSPGDWDRIVSYKDKFLSHPTLVRYPGPPGNGCVVENNSAKEGVQIPLRSAVVEMQDAAFYALIKNDAKIKQKVKEQLLWIAKNPRLNFNNGNVWCRKSVNDGSPNFDLAMWGVWLLNTYEYVQDAFSSSERSSFDNWIKGMAGYLQWSVDTSLNSVFVSRGGKIESYKYKDLPFVGVVTHAKGHATTKLQRIYNNRKAHMAQLVGLVGVKYNNSSYIATAKNFVKEAVAFLCYSDGTFGELHRSDRKIPSKGLSYLSNTFGAMISVADALARKGDNSLYEFKTSFGIGGTQGSTVKSLEWIITEYGKYLDGKKKIYSKEGKVGDEYYRVDGDHNGWVMVHDVSQFVMANLYYKNNYNKSVYLRKGPGFKGYPKHATGLANNASITAWKGLTGNVAGLFMYGQLEGKVWPYPSSSQRQDVVAPPMELIVDAGDDKSFSSTASKITLNGTAKIDGGSVKSYKWTKTSGPNANMIDVNKPVLVLNNLAKGEYIFRLTAEDDLGNKAFDDVKITITSPSSGSGNQSISFYRGINLNGAATVINGNKWESGKNAKNLSINGKAFSNSSVKLIPAVNSTFTDMVRSSLWRGTSSNVEVSVNSVPKGKYEVVVYTWEDNKSSTFELVVENKSVGKFSSGGKGSWKKINLGRVDISDGNIKVKAQGGDANLSGIEIWRVNSSSNAKIALQEEETVEQLQTVDKSEVMVYPNPFSHTVAINLTSQEKESETVSCQITDFYGNKIKTVQLKKASSDLSAEIDLSELRTGTYLFEIISGSNKRVVRGVKE